MLSGGEVARRSKRKANLPAEEKFDLKTGGPRNSGRRGGSELKNSENCPHPRCVNFLRVDGVEGFKPTSHGGSAPSPALGVPIAGFWACSGGVGLCKLLF